MPLSLVRQRSVCSFKSPPPVGELWAAGLLPLSCPFFSLRLIGAPYFSLKFRPRSSKTGLVSSPVGDLRAAFSSLAARFLFLRSVRQRLRRLGWVSGTRSLLSFAVEPLNIGVGLFVLLFCLLDTCLSVS